jgi:cysteinyl-tRNA synthetase
LHELANEAFQGRSGAAQELKGLAAILGLLQRTPEGFLQGGAPISEEWVRERIAARQAARERKDFKAADDIRHELLDKGIVLEDSGSKTTWRRK